MEHAASVISQFFILLRSDALFMCRYGTVASSWPPKFQCIMKQVMLNSEDV